MLPVLDGAIRLQLQPETYPYTHNKCVSIACLVHYLPRAVGMISGSTKVSNE